MMKTGATAMLAAATLAGSAAAQEAATCAPMFAHCVGPERADNGVCCPGAACVQKNDFYSQCRPNNEAAPPEWIGAVDLERSPVNTTAVLPSTPAPVNATTILPTPVAAVNGSVSAPVTPPVMMDAEDIVEMGLVPAGMTAEDVEELGLVPELNEAELAEEEALAAAPGAAVPVAPVAAVPTGVSYRAFIGLDYNVPVSDIEGAQARVASPQECEAVCTATPACNAASYYLTPVSGANCWPKMMMYSCDLPADASEDANAVLMLQVDAALCGEDALVADAPLAADLVDAMGPIADVPVSDMLDAAVAPAGLVLDPLTGEAVPPIQGPAVEDLAQTGTRALSDPSALPITTPSTVSDNSASVNVRGAMIALAVAGGAAFF